MTGKTIENVNIFSAIHEAHTPHTFTTLSLRKNDVLVMQLHKNKKNKKAKQCIIHVPLLHKLFNSPLG